MAKYPLIIEKNGCTNNVVVVNSLDLSNLPNAIRLINQEFPKQPAWEWAWLSLPISLLPVRILRLFGLSKLRYWTATIGASSQIVGISGLYAWRSEPETAWVGWTVIQPDCRRLGICSCLLNHVTQVAMAEGYRQLKVYTNKDSIANIVYQKRGFLEFRRSDNLVFYNLRLQ
jgi:ribosomal protein S18 acetylase RimI-like enzyme